MRNLLLTVALGMLALTGCRQDMHDQPRYEPLGESRFFPDGRGARPQVENTIARGQLKEDIALHYGKPAKDSKDWVATLPVKLDKALLERGRERFNIYCSPCHGLLGDGEGVVVQRGFKHPPTYHSDKMHQQPVGYYFDVITNGFGAMASYASRVPAADRWAIIAYIRALQYSRAAAVEDVPAADRAQLEAAAR